MTGQWACDLLARNPLQVLYVGSNDWREAMEQHPFVCVQWAGKEMNYRSTRSYNRSRQAKPVTSRGKKVSAEEGPCGLQLTRGPSSSSSLCLHWVLWWPRAYSPPPLLETLLPATLVTSRWWCPYTHHPAGVCRCGGRPRVHLTTGMTYSWQHWTNTPRNNIMCSG